MWAGKAAIFITLGLAVFGAAPAGGAVYRFDATETPAGRAITIYSTADIGAFRPLLEDFQRANPRLPLIYEELQTLELHERVLQEATRGTTTDLALSSAMDLQMKLANDGFAAPVKIDAANALPPWARWRNEVYGISFEPMVMVYNVAAFAERRPPQTRAELTALLDAPDAPFFGRLTAYDIERSGFGFLGIARDAAISEGIWQLVRSLGANRVKLFTNTSAMLDRIADGRSVLGYNLLGSYAASRAARDPRLGVVLPRDYTLVFSRLALVPAAAANPEGGVRFLDYLLSPRGQQVLAERGGINAIHPQVDGPNTAAAMQTQLGGGLRPIALGPGLLVYLDQVKRERLIRRWRRALGGR